MLRREPTTGARLVRFLAPSALVLAVVLGTAGAGTGDYVFIAPEHGVATGSCAKSLDACRSMQDAVQAGWFPEIAPDTPTRCEPKKDCFTERSLCIKSFNCDLPREHRR